MTMEVLFAGVAVTNLETAVQWYSQFFGRPPDVVPNTTEVMWRVTESGWLYVIQDADRAGKSVVTISVPDLEHVVGELTRRGIHPGPIEPVGDAGWKATSVDADGNEISLIQVTS